MGWRHFYSISRDGKTKLDLTPGEFDTVNIEAVDEKIDFYQNYGALLVLPPTKAIALDNRRVSFLLTRTCDLIELLESSNES